ncbi:hypothetical protein MKY87_18465 [Paenibacillus sp. FSL R7-0198]|uniref:hypothetical protein n=1 Tax=Paenibacillus sp. FSL R7-0198 TaxID=2921674 RepID=UPI0030F9181E
MALACAPVKDPLMFSGDSGHNVNTDGGEIVCADVIFGRQILGRVNFEITLRK